MPPRPFKVLNWRGVDYCKIQKYKKEKYKMEEANLQICLSAKLGGGELTNVRSSRGNCGSNRRYRGDRGTYHPTTRGISDFSIL